MAALKRQRLALVTLLVISVSLTFCSQFITSAWARSEVTGSDGLQYLHARYYDPVLNRQISPDPTAHPNQNVASNPYSYANNQPSVLTDPSGKSPPPSSFSSTVTPKQYLDALETEWQYVERDSWSARGWYYLILNPVSKSKMDLDYTYLAYKGYIPATLSGQLPDDDPYNWHSYDLLTARVGSDLYLAKTKVATSELDQNSGAGLDQAQLLADQDMYQQNYDALLKNGDALASQQLLALGDKAPDGAVDWIVARSGATNHPYGFAVNPGGVKLTNLKPPVHYENAFDVYFANYKPDPSMLTFPKLDHGWPATPQANQSWSYPWPDIHYQWKPIPTSAPTPPTYDCQSRTSRVC